MQQITNIWANLDWRKRIIVLGATLAVFASLVGMTRIASSPSMTLLYAGLEPGAAGEIVRALDAKGTTYEVRGGSIYVPSMERDELRMTLASEGMPANGGKGYELLDSLSGFGTTSQMFDAAYWRAKEGELARTIVANPHVAQARVHIANSTANPFLRSADPTASVSIVPSGGSVTPAQANAIRYLVASAVTGLEVENVAVIDATGAVIGSPETTPAASTAEDRAQQLRERVLRLVEARVGRGNAVVEVSVETVTETESIRERRIDPNGRVAISTDVEERSDTSRNQSADVTVASNLPDGDGATGDESNSSTSETRERVNYEVSETELEIVRVPGAIKRLSVAVLVDGIRGTDEAGAATIAERPEGEMEALRELVESAVGFDAARGDVITLKSMDLPSVAPQGTVANASAWPDFLADPMAILQMATLALVSLILGFFVIRPVLMRPAPDTLSLPPGDPANGADVTAPPVLMGEVQNEDGSFGTAGDGQLPAIAATPSEDAVARLQMMIGDKQEETVEILRSWLEEREEKA
ncbi:flagellar basal-body MS-ring/collar protein FliF [Lutimaribacter marinistellae]|uniref:Flagellar M-ring protein n=1 Tax=Lutimaribacter marinistellae TaxID=1820329 RepID=A0ABV7TAQ5_9RHOB